MAFHAVIFDLDGTLIDSMGVWEEVPDQLVRRLGGEPFPGLADALRTRDLRGGAEKLIQIYGWDLTADQVLEEADRLLDETYSTAVPLKPGAGELVRQLHEKGVPLCIATASTEGQAVGAMRHFGLADGFSFVLSCTRYGGKNRPDIFLEAAGGLISSRRRSCWWRIRSIRCARLIRQALAPPEWQTPRRKQSVQPWSRPAIISSKPCRTSMCR